MGRETLKYRRELGPRPRSAALAALAAKQHGVVTRAQLRELGWSDGAVDGALRARRLHRVHRSVFAVGHAVLTREGRWMAAVLASGPGAVLSHRSAAALWRIRERDGREPDVTVGRSGRRVKGVAVHRTRRIEDTEITQLNGIPTTTLPRTIADLADLSSEDELSRAIHQSEITHSLADRALHDATRRAHGRHGSGRLKRATNSERDRTRSGLERRFLALCNARGIPRPAVNEEVAGRERDFVWREQRLVVEVDSWRYHRTRRAFGEDRKRDQGLIRAGFQTLRFTDLQIVDDEEEVAATVLAGLAG